MLDLAHLADLDVAGLVPDVYADFRPVVTDALAFFLEHLSPKRLEAIVRAQLALPPDADVAHRAVHFMHACPALHKLGQVLARCRELDIGLCGRLQQLETLEPKTPIAHIRPLLVRELRAAIPHYRIQLADAPLAEGSVATVVPITWSEPADRHHPQHGVLKVLKPDAAQHLAEDLAIIARLADWLDQRRSTGTLGDLPYRQTFDDVRQLLEHEVRLEEEQANLSAASAQYGDIVPQLLPFSTPHITAMQRLFGVKVTELPASCGSQRRRLAHTIGRTLIADVLLCRDESRRFHADPHAGNLLATNDGGLGVLDWSLVGRLSRAQRHWLAQVVFGSFTADPERIGRAVEALAVESPDASIVRPTVDRALEGIGGRALPDLDWIMHLLDELALKGVRFGPDLMLFRKSFFTLEGVIADVSPGQSLQSTLLGEAMLRLAEEWPSRMLASAGSGAYATQLSNADLLYMAAAAPAAAVRYWLQTWRQVRGSSFSLSAMWQTAPK